METKDKPVMLPTLKVEAQSSTVELLKDMLRLAEAGEVTQVMIVGIRKDGNAHTWSSPMTQTFKMIGALEHLKFDVMMARVKDRDEEGG